MTADKQTADAFSRYINSPCDNTLNDLFVAVRNQAMKQVCNDDVAQEVCLHVLKSISNFSATDYYAITRYVAAVTATERLRLRNPQRLIQPGDGEEQAVPDEPFISLSELKPLQKTVAKKLLDGYTLKEAAAGLGTTTGALRKKLSRMRPLSSLPPGEYVEALSASKHQVRTAPSAACIPQQ